MTAADSFMVRRAAAVERELGLMIRAALARHESPATELVTQHKEAWDRLRQARTGHGTCAANEESG